MPVSKSLYRSWNYGLEPDFVAWAAIGSVSQALVVNAALPPKTVQDPIALAKKRPDENTYVVTMGGAPESFGKLIATDVTKFAEVVEAANMQVD